MARTSTFPFTVPFVRWADSVLTLAGGIMPLRRIYDHELVYVLSGHGHIFIGDTPHPAAPDSLFLILPREWHSFRADAGENMTLLGVHFDWAPQHDTLLFPIFRAADEPIEEARFREPRTVPGWDLRKSAALNLKGRPRVRQLLESVVRETSHEQADERLGAGALLAAALVQIGNEAQSLSQLAKAAPYGADAARRVDRARALLEEHIAQPLSIEQVAEEVSWSADHLRRMFRAVLNKSPAKVQTAARMRLARHLLRHEAMPIQEIALACGFDDPSHFARVFKKENGLSPRQYVMLAKYR